MVVEGWSFGLIYCHRAWAPSYLVEYEFYLDKRIHECEACLTAEDWANGTMIPRKPAYVNQISWKIIMVSQWPSQSPYLNLTEVLLQDLEKLCINECPPRLQCTEKYLCSSTTVWKMKSDSKQLLQVIAGSRSHWVMECNSLSQYSI